MTENNIYNRLGEAISRARPGFVEQFLRPGLSPRQVDKYSGSIVLPEPIQRIYCWKNGTAFIQIPSGQTYAQAMLKAAFFCGDGFQFVDLRRALSDRELLNLGQIKYSAHRNCLPLFFNTKSAYLLADLSSNEAPVSVVDDLTDSPPRQVFKSFNDFIEAVIASIESGVQLPLL